MQPDERPSQKAGSMIKRPSDATDPEDVVTNELN